MLREGIQLSGDLISVRDLWPVRGHDLVRGSPQQESVGGCEPFGHVLPHCLVRIRNHPAALLEPAAWVLRWAAWALHDPIQRQERRQGQLHSALLRSLRLARRVRIHRGYQHQESSPAKKRPARKKTG